MPPAPAGPAASARQSCLPIEAGDERTPIVAATLNGQGPFAFVLDTAASGTAIDPETLAQLGAPRDAETEEAQGMGGAIEVRFHRLQSLEAGPLALRDFIAPAIPAPEFDSHAVVGLAGIDLLGTSLALWSPREGCVRIAPSGATPEGDWRTVEVRWLRPWKVMLPISIGGVSGWALLDTGAQYTTLNPAFAAHLGLTEDSGRLRPSGAIAGIDGRELALSQADVRDVAIGDWRWPSQTVRIGALPVFERLSEAGDTLAIIGMDWLADESFAIDYGTETVWLKAQDSR